MTDRPLPTGWISDQLANFIKPRGEKVSPSDFPEFKFIGMDNIESQTTKILGSVPAQTMKSNASRFYEGDVLYGRLRPYLNKVAQVNFNGLASAEFIVFPDTPIIKSSYLKYRLNAADFVSFASHLNEGDRPRVSFEQIGTFNLLLPPLPEQHRIVDKIEELFSDLDDGIASLKKAQQQLKVYRQAVLKWAFEGKLTAQWREEQERQGKLESAETLLEQIKVEREQRYQEKLAQWKADVKAWEANGKVGKKPGKPSKLSTLSPLSEDEVQQLSTLPQGWVWVRYGLLCSEVRNGISAKPNSDNAEKILRISSVRAFSIDLSDFRYIENPNGIYDTYFLRAGDILFTRYNGSRHYVGVCAKFNSGNSYLYPDKLIRTRLISASLVSSDYIVFAANSGSSRVYIERQIKTTAGQSGVSGQDIKLFPIPLCSLQEQQIICGVISERFSVIDQLESEINTNLQQAEALRQSILKRAFEGKLVPQDPNDEPASVLLERIRQTRNKQGQLNLNGL